MYSAPFEYVRASSWPEAVDLLEGGGEDARVIAGGQSLVPMMMLRLAAPSLLVDVSAAADRSVDLVDAELVLSALVRHADIEHSEVVRGSCPMLTEAVTHIGNVRVRHRGTIGGSLAHGEPTAELATVAVAEGATVTVLGPGGERAIPAGDLFVTHFTTSLEPGEVVTAVRFPVPGGRRGSSFQEIARRAGDFALVEAAATVALDEDDRCLSVRLVVGAVSDRPVDVSQAARPLIGERIGEDAVGEVARAVAAEIEVGPHTHAGREYRRRLVSVLAGRALLTAADRAAGAVHTDHGNGARA